METRTVEQVKLYKLWLHEINEKRPHIVCLVAISYEKQKLMDWYTDQLETEPYQELLTPAMTLEGPSIIEQEAVYITKHFKKGSKLEPFEPCTIEKYNQETDIGINAAWTTQEHIDMQMKTMNDKIFFVDPITAE